MTLEVKGWRGGRQGEDGRASIAGPMPTVLASKRVYVYVIVDDYNRAVYTRPLRARDSVGNRRVQSVQGAAENESERRIREIMRS